MPWLVALACALPALLLLAVVLAEDLRRGWHAGPVRAARTLRATPPKRSSQAIDGRPIKIVGRASAPTRELEAPITGVRCLAWRLVVQLVPGDGAGRTVVDECEVPSELSVEDDGALVRVRAERRGSPCVLWNERGAWVEASTPALRALLRSKYVSTRTTAGRDGERDRRLWLREELVLPGDRVAVLGTAIWETDTDLPPDGATYREARRSLVLVDTSDRPVVLSPRPEMWR